MSNNPMTPVIVGVGEVSESPPEDIVQAKTPVQLAVMAALAAFQDAGLVESQYSLVDGLAMVRAFADSTPMYANPFGGPVNPPRAVAAGLGIDPKCAVYDVSGGQSPQALLCEFSNRIAKGEFNAVLIVGSEALANMKMAMRAGVKLDWNDDNTGLVDDRGIGMAGLINNAQIENDLMTPGACYSILDNARRSKLGLSREQYFHESGKLLAPFSGVAAEREHALNRSVLNAEQIATPSEVNPLIFDSYTKAMMAQDGVNQAAAILLVSNALADDWDVAQENRVYPVAYANTREKIISDRPDLSTSPAMAAAYAKAFERADLAIDDVDVMDVYSCFPIAVFSACDALGLRPDDPRGLTTTGGLSFFGGAGNNYSMHGIVGMVDRLRGGGKKIGMVGANGGMLSKHSVAIYSRGEPLRDWQEFDDGSMQAELDQVASVSVVTSTEGAGVVESFSVTMKRGVPVRGHIIGRTECNNRFIAVTDISDYVTPQRMMDSDPVGCTVYTTGHGPGVRFTFDKRATEALRPTRSKTLRDNYEFCSVTRNSHVLEITINRPEVMNCLNPPANDELDEVFDIFEADPELRVAILTGAGDRAFCTGNDLKYAAKGNKVWVPAGGMGGLTHRKGRVKPVVVAVNGMALGGGMEIVLAADIVIASDSASFGLPEVNVGLIAGAGGIQRLTRLLPRNIALELLFSGRRVSAEEAKVYGFVNSVLPADLLMQRAREYAADLAEKSPVAISCILQLLNETNDITDVVDSVRVWPKALDRLLTSEDMIEGSMAFAQKRKPVWKGR
jgi:acetyl-CoA C-acetyltransferase